VSRISMRRAGIIGAMLVAWMPLKGGQPQQPSGPASVAAPQFRAVLNKYCVTCHNERLKTADLMLDKADVLNVPAGTEVWEKVIKKLRGNAMPPPGLPRPDNDFYATFPIYLETAIDQAAAKPNPGRPAVHRLNRAEYTNAIHDLLAVDIAPEALLPSDDAGYGFDNNGDVLSVSPLLLERYLAAARKISWMAIGDPAFRPVDEAFELPADLRQDQRMSEDLPLGTRGGEAIRYDFPADGEYLIKVRLVREAGNGAGMIRGVALKNQIDVSLDQRRLQRFSFGGERFGAAGDEFTAADPRQSEFDTNGADAGLELRIAVTAGPHLVGVAFPETERSEPEGTSRGRGRTTGRFAPPAVNSVTIRGPYSAKSLGQTPSRNRIFVCEPDHAETGTAVRVAYATGGIGEEACARKILSTLAHRAYRRPLTETDLRPLIGIYKIGSASGGFEEGIRMAIEAMLVSPDFLFRKEHDPANATPGKPYHISDLELASRLSFFLWSTIPDTELLGLAERGALREPAVLEQQVQRMMRDPRFSSFVENFTGQWLQLRRMSELSPDLSQFPDYDENLRRALMRETSLFLESMVRENHTLSDLLSANYTYLNERLARHYGVPNIYGSTFRRVTLTDPNRFGLLGQGSILALTSYPNRTSVVLRGVWLLTNILATPPPPPPPNVPPLKDRDDDGRIKSVRESMEEHRANPGCAACHLRMDPLGFAMENFNAIGQWRTVEGATHTPIDNSGQLPDGTKFKGPAELRTLLLGKPDQFATSVIEKLLTYALGRGVEYYDEPAVRKIRRETRPEGYRWTSIIEGVIKSEPFQMRSAQP